MYNIEDIQEVHLEISSLCNARCPECPRNYRGFPYNDGYPETNLTLAQAQKIFEPLFLHQLQTILINGNYGDIVMNEEAVDIVRYFRQHNKTADIYISTNGSARRDNFWQELAELDCKIEFDLDGMADTHTLYRQNTNWNTVIKNAKTFIDAGGYAVWKFIKFKHNQHQVNDCEELSKQLGFSVFKVVEEGRDQGPVYDKQGELVHVLGDWTHHWDGVDHKTVEPYIAKRKGEMLLFDDIAQYFTPAKQINCEVKKTKSVYITANGEVYPCCYLGFYPKTSVGFGEQLEVLNKQLRPLIDNNNALEHPLSECIAWFNEIEKSWSCSTYKDGRLMKCDQQCGAK
jgi:MoaA/NifB/PqqE/SkfB family radical SAM enzyme